MRDERTPRDDCGEATRWRALLQNTFAQAPYCCERTTLLPCYTVLKSDIYMLYRSLTSVLGGGVFILKKDEDEEPTKVSSVSLTGK